MAKVKKANTVNPAPGRPSPYTEAYNAQAYKLCLLGATDKELADFFEVAESTINLWKINHPQFSESIRNGKMVADMEVASRLFDSTGDRELTEKKAVKLKEVFWDENGKRCERETVELVDETRVVPGDVRAQQHWLNNRKPDKWRNSQDINHLTDGHAINQLNLGEGVPPQDTKNTDDSE